ncbi:hypothetical protein AMJ80_10095 [bacterium SM23_31]|nr:MAG: hypothetical protein AMJ80_10095 [bacterium SM23_31]
MRRRSSRHKQLITGVVFITLAVIISLSIISYNTKDYDPSTGFNEKGIENLIKRVGAFVSFYLIKYTFGYAVLIPCLLLLLWGWQIIRPKSGSAGLKRFYFYALCTMFLISFGLAIKSEFAIGGSLLSYEYSGLVGGFFASNANMYLGKIGTIIVYFAFVFILLVLWSQLPFWKAVNILENIPGKVWGWRKVITKNVIDAIERNRRKKKLKTSLKRSSAGGSEIDIPLIPKKKVSIIERIETAKRGDTKLEEWKSKKEQPFSIFSRKDTGQISGNEIDTELMPATGTYEFPSLDLLDNPPSETLGDSRDDIIQKADILENTLLDFGVQAKVAEVHPGPVLTLYEVRPDTGVKINRILSLQDDLALAMKAKGIRIIAPIPGKDTVGIEIPNHKPSTVYLKSLLADPGFKKAQSNLTIALGRTITGEAFFTDLAKMPHLLIAGSTGSGKSVGISTIITSILFRTTPADVQFVMIDPKRLELSVFKKLHAHHLLTAEFLDEAIITKPQNAVIILNSCVTEMGKRYDMMAKAGVRNIEDYNAKKDKPLDPDTGEPYPGKLENIVIIIDELADLMLIASKDIEEPIARLAQMARAVGMHIILATQRPSVDVLTGVIKANFPARIAYQVATKVDSRTILDMNGAETLLGSGDMLYLPPGSPKPTRLQNAFVSYKEIERVVDHIASQPKFRKNTVLSFESQKDTKKENGLGGYERDPLFNDAARLVVIHQQGSISLLQRRLKIGYSRAARLIDEMEDAGIVGPYDGSKARQVLLDENDLDEFI